MAPGLTVSKIERGQSQRGRCQITNINEISAQRDANTARALAVVRFGHRPPARCKHTNTQTRL